MKGRKPTPVEQRIKEGNTQRRPLPEPITVEGLPRDLQPPDHLPKSAKEIWLEIVPPLAKIGLLDNIDRFALEAMCVQYARGRQAGRVLSKQGHLVRGSQGQPREHPSLRTERAAHQMFLQFAEQYALTPVARTRLGLAELQRRSMLEEVTSQIGSPDIRPVDAEVVEG